MFSNFQQQQHHNLFHTSRECQTSEEDDSRGSGGPATLTPHKPFSAISGSSDGATIEIGRRPRGRPPGSKNKPKSPLIITHEPEPAMSPHVLEIPEGSDIVEAISRFSNRRKTGLCILTGSGAVANVTLCNLSPPLLHLDENAPSTSANAADLLAGLHSSGITLYGRRPSERDHQPSPRRDQHHPDLPYSPPASISDNHRAAATNTLPSLLFHFCYLVCNIV